MKKLHLFFLIIFVCGCNKDKFSPAESNLAFAGKVLDYTTGQPVGNAMVNLALGWNLYFDSWPKNYYTTTDAEGNYYFSVPDANQTDYRIYASKTGLVFVDTNIYWLHNLIGNSPYLETVFLDAASILQIRFHDINPSSNNDTLNVRVGFGDSLTYSPYWGTHSHQTTINFNTTVQFFDSASYKQNSYATIIYTVFNNGFNPEMDTTIQLVQFGTKVVDIYY